jgi:hypothetical protein
VLQVTPLFIGQCHCSLLYSFSSILHGRAYL